MTPAQNTAFQGATGHTATGVGDIVSSILVVLLFIWAAWLVVQVLGSLRRNEAIELDLLFVSLRASALIWIALYLVQ